MLLSCATNVEEDVELIIRSGDRSLGLIEKTSTSGSLPVSESVSVKMKETRFWIISGLFPVIVRLRRPSFEIPIIGKVRT